jgi:diguanylate cyclase (GGDEF)-like protein
MIPEPPHHKPPPALDSENIATWREQLLNGLLGVSLALGLLAAIPSALFSIQASRWQIALVDLFVMGWIATLWYFRGMGYRWRAHLLLGAFYVLSVVLLVYAGPVAHTYLMAIPVLAVVLLNLRIALLTLALNGISISCVGYYTHVVNKASGLTSSPFLEWLVVAVNTLAVNALLTLSCWYLISSFEKALKWQKIQAQKLKTLVYYDEVTGLPTAMAHRERMESLVDSNRPFTLLALNLDDFLLVNNNLGMKGGNAILAQAANAIKNAMGSHAELSRASGAEFLLIVPDVIEHDALHDVTRRVFASLETPFSYEGGIVYVTMSIGYARFPVDSSSVDELLRMTTVALHEVKAKGIREVRAYDPSLEVKPQEHVWLDHHLRLALGEQQFSLFYQPKVLLETGRATSVEALLRWTHPERGQILPDQFISRSEATGLIIPIGRWVIATAAAQARTWLAQDSTVRIAINVSAKQLSDPELIPRLKAAQAQAQGLLDIELTESCLLDSESLAIAFISQCRDMGYGVHLDDFGTGYSSLARLGNLPLTKIKLDRAFIAPIGQNPKSDALLKAMISIGNELHVPIVAEGVETQEQADYLRSHGVRYAQGWLFARAMSADDCGWWLANNLMGRTDEEAAPSNFIGLV